MRLLYRYRQRFHDPVLSCEPVAGLEVRLERLPRRCIITVEHRRKQQGHDSGSRHVAKRSGVNAQIRFQVLQFRPEFLPVCLAEFRRDHARMSLGGKRPHLLVKDDDCDPREVDAVTAVALDRLTSEREQGVNTLQSFRFLAFFGFQLLRGNAGDRLLELHRCSSFWRGGVLERVAP
jgi:hypothetical protein